MTAAISRVLLTKCGAPTRILYQRGVYPVDDFHTVKKYGQPLLVTQDIVLERYIDRCALCHPPRQPALTVDPAQSFATSQQCGSYFWRPINSDAPQAWLMSGDVTQLVVVIVAKDSRVPLERWVFDVTLVDDGSSAEGATQRCGIARRCPVGSGDAR